MGKDTHVPVDAVDAQQLTRMVADTPPAGKHRGMFAIAAVATLGSLLFGYDTGVISGALPYMYMPAGAGGLHLSALQEGAIGATLTFGAAFGALFGGRLSDRYGRRHNLIMLAIIFIIGSLGCTFAPNVWVMYLFRFVLGLAVGGASATVPVFLAETAPKHIRGTIVALDQLMIVTGQLLAFSMNAVVNSAHGGPQLTVTADPSGHISPGSYSWDTLQALQRSEFHGSKEAFQTFIEQLVVTAGNGNAWRFMLVLCTIPAIGLWLGMHLMPESSRWYVAQGKFYQAIGALKRVRVQGRDDVEGEMAEMIAIQRQRAHEPKLGFGDVINTPWLRKLMLVGIFLAIVNQTTGVNTVMYYAPKVLSFAGMGTSAAISAQVANGIMSVLGASLGLWLIAKFTRRQILIADVIGVGICLLAIAGVFTYAISSHVAEGATTAPPAWAAYSILGLMAVFMLIVQSSNGTVVWTMLGEIFPATARGVMNGTAVFCMWMVNALITATFPKMMEGLGGGITYTIYGVMNLVIAVILWKIMPETANKSMEEIEVYVRERYDD